MTAPSDPRTQDPDPPGATMAGGAPPAPSSGPDAMGPAARARAFVGRPTVRSVVAGTLLAGSLPPWGWWPLAFLGIAVLDRLLAGARWQARMGRGTVVGLALFGPTVVWISQLTAPGYVVAVLL
ncbi:MAG: hypothetical protein ACR2MB_16980, partial [Acidimicrobiales bacterium]